MKTIVLGNANAEGYDVVGQFEYMAEAIERLAERDIEVVVASEDFLSMFSEREMEILNSTISRYGARLEREER